MATVIDAKRWVLQQLNTARQAGELPISGNVYIDKKPPISKDGIYKEDIVINSITADNDFFQTILINVNCYAQDLQVNAGSGNFYTPNISRLDVISKAVYKALKDNTQNQVYRSFIESSQQEEEPDENAHFINFRIRINAKNN